jgi:hypothetical protein
MKVILQSIILNKSSIKINVLFPIPHSLFPIPQKALHQMKVILLKLIKEIRFLPKIGFIGHLKIP